MVKYDYSNVICYLEPKHALKFISHFSQEMIDMVDFDVIDDGALVLKWKRS